MILTITPNPALDMTWHVEELRAGQTHRLPAGVSRAGGKGVNVARVLQAEGHRVIALTTQGGATGDEFRAELQSAGVAHELVSVAAPLRRSVAIVDAHANQTTVLNELGAPLERQEIETLIERATALAAEADASAISGSLPQGFSHEDFARLISGVASGGSPMIVDTSGEALLIAARAGASALKPNEEELQQATGESDPRRGGQVLLGLGAKLVVVSQGERGLFAVRADGTEVHGALPHVVHGNATGAGDAVSAAIVAALAADPSGSDIDNLVRRAVAWGAAAVAMPLAGEISADAHAWESDVVITRKAPRA